MLNEALLKKAAAIRRTAAIKAQLEREFFPTPDFELFLDRVFQVLEDREERLKVGAFEHEATALIGPAGSGKSRITQQVIQDFQDNAEATGGRQFGSKIISVIVPARATIKDTLRAALRETGYPCEANRDEDYLSQRLNYQFENQHVAALHLDEVQDSGRHKTSDSMKTFGKKFRNLMQKGGWQVSLILTGTLEAREFINHEQTLTRRSLPVEILPLTYETDGGTLRASVGRLVHRAGLIDGGLLDEPEFLKILMHASAYRFGMALNLIIEAIGVAIMERESEISLDHFAGAYYIRMNCSDEVNPFMSQHWRAIETTVAMDRSLKQREQDGKVANRTVRMS